MFLGFALRASSSSGFAFLLLARHSSNKFGSALASSVVLSLQDNDLSPVPFIDFMLGEILNTLKSHQGTEQSDYNPNESQFDKQFGISFGKEFGVKFGIKFGDNEKQLLLSLNSNPGMTAQELADNLGITKRAVEKQIKKLRELNVLTRQGSAKNGLWVINR